MSGTISLCSFTIAGRSFGVDTLTIREVLGAAKIRAVPHSPAYVGGVIAYRGDVLTAVCLRAVLGQTSGLTSGCVLVLDGDAEEHFGLMVDEVGGVVTVDSDSMAANPTTLDEASRLLFYGAFQTQDGLMVHLDPKKLQPQRLAASGLFTGGLRTRWRMVETVEGGKG